MLDEAFQAGRAARPAARERRASGLGASEELLSAALSQLVRRGVLLVRFPSGRERRFGSKDAAPVSVTLHGADAVRRLIANPELAVGELYADDQLTIEDDDLDALLALLLENLRDRGFKFRATPAGLRLVDAPKREVNGLRRAERNVAHHYDISNDFYRLFLDADQQYSCAYFETPDDTLDEAQTAKKELIAAKLLLRPDLSVLDVGCGWGGLALHLAASHGARVRGITLSQAQLEAAARRAETAGLGSRVTFALEDYRRTTGRYDRIVSVGMFEHVGRAHFDDYFQMIAARLAEDGVALVHTIGRADGPGATNPWIDRYIFPGGYAPALSEVLPAIERAGLYVTDIEIWRLHYALTLRAWRERFEARIEQVRAMFDERFCRMWRFYLAASEAAFRHAGHVVFQIQLARRQDAAPLTRGYLAPRAKGARQGQSGAAMHPSASRRVNSP